MKKIDVKIVQKAGDYVTLFLAEKLPESMIFHTIDHTKYVVEKSEIIGRKSGLTEDQLNQVKLCAWFHDVGYAIIPEKHEEESVKIASEFLKSQGSDDQIINQVTNCILATRIPQQPADILSQVLCDADLMHLAEDDYFERLDKMRKEWANLSGEKISKRRFHKISKKFFQRHSYHTDFAKTELHPKKAKNLQLIEQEIYKLDQKKEKKMLESKQKKVKPKAYSRGVESMFRTTARNQINLSSIADNKSNILISVNAIIMSITITILVTRFDEVPNIIIPTLIFLLFSLITIVFAILSTRPNISSGTFTKEDIRQNKVNLLFFGNFYNMKLDDYEWAIEELMKNDKNLYSTMIKDQYSLGKVLVKKYKLLRIAYNVFMFGMIISVLAFMLAFINI
ncbi:MAG: HD family phosphohydrolase [Bacteroidetes bacterium HGW-Bacteroidetes-16]|jgi:predicted metal-dependent HD superfamily phosphohydrolase|nr:MAG: HD family phosphohydrolase [Bacteroidetes bacterium HGW-Bacteroidetes-16]